METPTRLPGTSLVRSLLIITALVTIVILVFATLLRMQLGDRIEACRWQALYPGAQVVSETQPGFFQVSGSFESVLTTADTPAVVDDWYETAYTDAQAQAIAEGTQLSWTAAWDIQPDGDGSTITLFCP